MKKKEFQNCRAILKVSLWWQIRDIVAGAICHLCSAWLIIKVIKIFSLCSTHLFLHAHSKSFSWYMWVSQPEEKYKSWRLVALTLVDDLPINLDATSDFLPPPPFILKCLLSLTITVLSHIGLSVWLKTCISEDC